MAITKKTMKSKPVCKVTFQFPKDGAESFQAKKINLVGDFNNWDQGSMPMKKQKDGSFSVSLELEKGREYQFKYLINENTWENDWSADKYVTSPFSGTENSVVIAE